MPHWSRRMDLRDATVEASVITASGKVMPVGAAAGVYGWLISVNWIGWLGVLVALTGLFVSYYFQRRRDKREKARELREQETHEARREEHRARMAQLLGKCNVE